MEDLGEYGLRRRLESNCYNHGEADQEFTSHTGLEPPWIPRVDQ